MPSETESLYWRDLPDWSEQQAAALRALSVRSDLPNSLDLEHLIEEVEALGRSQISAAISPMRLILEHLIKLAARPGSLSARHWQAEILNWHAELLQNYAPSMRQRVDLDDVWRKAAGIAGKRLGAPLRLPAHCPISLDDLLADPLDIDAAVTRIGHVF